MLTRPQFKRVLVSKPRGPRSHGTTGTGTWIAILSSCLTGRSPCSPSPIPYARLIHRDRSMSRHRHGLLRYLNRKQTLLQSYRDAPARAVASARFQETFLRPRLKLDRLAPEEPPTTSMRRQGSRKATGVR